jgi:hypothetical protein
MWETSKSPAAERTASCSATTPEYCTGMSQPAKSTIRAPKARWAAFNGVFWAMAGLWTTPAGGAQSRLCD